MAKAQNLNQQKLQTQHTNVVDWGTWSKKFPFAWAAG